MNKQDFITNLHAKLTGLSEQEAQERLNFYSEMIDDRIEEGLFGGRSRFGNWLCGRNRITNNI